MLEEIASTYYDFDDALVNEFKYTILDRANSLEIQICCMSSKTGKWENIWLKCSDILYFRFSESAKVCSHVINTALLKTEGDVMTIDFFPTVLGGRNFEENLQSDFIVKFKDISVEVIAPV